MNHRHFSIAVIVLIFAAGLGANTAAARFLATDPAGYQDQTNLYAYVHNDPVNNLDPNGECTAGTGVVQYHPICLYANFQYDYYRGLGAGALNSTASIGHALASSGALGGDALARARAVNLGIDAAATVAANNSSEIAELAAHQMLDRPIGEQAGQFVAGAAPAYALARLPGATVGSKVGVVLQTSYRAS